jgi:4-oxalocrotonate tautomerase family enzyme
MPYIKIELTKEGVTREQKQQLIKGVTDLITDVLNKDPQLTHVVIQEVELDDWGLAGEQVSGLRDRGITASNAKAQTNQKMDKQYTDSTAIATALDQYYFKGIEEGNLDLLKQVYYPGTLLFGDVKGQAYFKTLDQYLDGVKNRQSPKDSGKPFQGTILSVSVVNSIAVAEVKVKMYDFNYHEFLSFHKLDGRWVIVNKMISDVQP